MSSCLPYLINGVSYGDPEKRRRQEFAADRIEALRGDILLPINFCAPDENIYRPDWINESTLRLVSFPETHSKRLPLARDLFDQASAVAQIYNSEWFAVANDDIVITEKWIGKIQKAVQGDEEVLIFPRTNIDRDQEGQLTLNPAFYHQGQDLYVCRVAAWERIRTLFQSYFFGEAYWDNVFTSLFLTHAKGLLVMDELGLCLHERHPKSWGNSPFYHRNRLLASGPDMIASLRWKYFHHGWMLRREERGRLLNELENRQLIREVFIPPLEEEIEFANKMNLRASRMGLIELGI